MIEQQNGNKKAHLAFLLYMKFSLLLTLSANTVIVATSLPYTLGLFWLKKVFFL
jgi:hypothetical protein